MKRLNVYHILQHLSQNSGYIIHISHGFEGDIPDYQPRGDTKALARYVTRCRKPWRVMSPDAEGRG
mgnify:CR=1 FL=1